MATHALRSSSGRFTRKSASNNNTATAAASSSSSADLTDGSRHRKPTRSLSSSRLKRSPVDADLDAPNELQKPGKRSKFPLPQSRRLPPTEEHRDVRHSTRVHAALAAPAALSKRRVPQVSTTGSPPPPPLKLDVTSSHGQPIQEINGVRTRLKASSDDEKRSKAKTAKSTKAGLANGVATAPAVNGNTGRDKRTLRSQDAGQRFKSELEIYFPNYSEIITDAPKEKEFLSLETPIYLTDTPLINLPTHTQPPRPAGRRHARQSSGPSSQAYTTPSKDLNGAHYIDFSGISRSLVASTHPITDPLGDEVYQKPHARAERKEKQLRNIERERAQHEKVQLERLLDGLQGPEWLRVMGVGRGNVTLLEHVGAGANEAEERGRKMSAKRKYFIAEVAALVEKFRTWREEEKRMKAERDAALREEDEAGSEADVEDGEEYDYDEDEAGSSFPSSSELDADATAQLLAEASMSSSAHRQKRPKGPVGRPRKVKPEQQKLKVATSTKPLQDGLQPDTDSKTNHHPLPITTARRPGRPPGKLANLSSPLRGPDSEPDSPSIFSAPPPPAPHTLLPPKVMHSFFEKQHLRDAALGKVRHGRYGALAFGCTVPETERAEFSLPALWLTKERLREVGRKRRAARREGKK